MVATPCPFATLLRLHLILQYEFDFHLLPGSPRRRALQSVAVVDVHERRARRVREQLRRRRRRLRRDPARCTPATATVAPKRRRVPSTSGFGARSLSNVPQGGSVRVSGLAHFFSQAIMICANFQRCLACACSTPVCVLIARTRTRTRALTPLGTGGRGYLTPVF